MRCHHFGSNLLNVMSSILGMSNPGLIGFFINIFPDISCRVLYSRMVFKDVNSKELKKSGIWPLFKLSL